MPPSLEPVNFLGGEELIKICSKNFPRTQPELHTRLVLPYTIAIAAVVKQSNINVHAPGRMFEQGTPPSLVKVNFLDGEKLAKILSMSVHQTQPELHNSLVLQYTIAMAAIVNQLNINVDAPGRMFKR